MRVQAEASVLMMPAGDVDWGDVEEREVDWDMVDRQAAKRQKLLLTSVHYAVGPDQQVHMRHFGEREGDVMIVREF